MKGLWSLPCFLSVAIWGEAIPLANDRLAKPGSGQPLSTNIWEVSVRCARVADEDIARPSAALRAA